MNKDVRAAAAREAAIREIIDARARAVRAGDVDGMMANVADDVLIFDAVGPLYREGREASRARRHQGRLRRLGDLSHVGQTGRRGRPVGVLRLVEQAVGRARTALNAAGPHSGARRPRRSSSDSAS